MELETLHVFISYASRTESIMAGHFKSHLQYISGCKVFLAHEDIVVSTEWELRIIKTLKECDVVVLYYHQNTNNLTFVIKN